MNRVAVQRGRGGLASAVSCGRLLGAYAVILACVQVLTIGLSLSGAHMGRGIAAGVLALSVVAGMLVYRWGRRPGAAEGAGDAFEEAVSPGSRGATIGASVALALVYLLLWWIAILSVDLTCDGNAYHLPPISLWWRAGGVYWIDPRMQLEPLMNGYPKGVELVGYVLARALDTSSVANGLNLIYLPLGVLGLGYLARRLGGAAWSAPLAGLLYLLLPVTIWQSPTAYLDSAYASAFIGLAAALVMVERACRRGVGLDPWLAVVLGSAAGLALGAKGSAGATVGLVFLLLLAAATQSALEQGSGRGRTMGRAVGVLAVAAVVALIVGGYWYVRNWIHTGTPLYPVGVSIGGRTIFPGIAVAEALWEEGNTPSLYRLWPEWRRIGYAWLQGLRDWPETVFAVDGRLGGLGYVWVLAGLPASLYCLVDASFRRPRERRAWLLLALVVVASFAVTPMRWWARYTLWLHALGLPALMVALTRLSRVKGVRRAAWAWGLAVLMLAGWEGWLCGSAMARSVYPARWPPRGVAFFQADNWWRPHVYLFPEVGGTLLSDILRGDDPVAVGPMWTVSPSGRYKHNLLGALTLPLGRRDLMPLPGGIAAADLVALRNEMRARGIRYAIWDDQVEVPAVLRYLAEEETAVPGFIVLTVASE